MNDEPFQLCNDPPPHRPRKPEPRERQKQKTLFDGLDCLPDQQDLFPTDGEAVGTPPDPDGGFSTQEETE